MLNAFLLNVAIFTRLSEAHGNMVWPPTWFDPNGDGVNKGQSCAPSASAGPAFGKKVKELRLSGTVDPYQTGWLYNEIPACYWFNNDTIITDRTLPRDLSTYPEYQDIFYYYNKSPWFAPGTAKFADGSEISSCGYAGGNPKGCPVGEDGIVNCPTGGFSNGPDSIELDFLEASTVTDWKVGSVVEAMFGISANHGGGYSFRLCPADSKLDEECFQANALEFATDKQWAQFGKDESTRVEWDIQIYKDAKGNEWSKLPMPACGTLEGGAFTEHLTHCDDTGCRCSDKLGTQFPAPAPGIEGFGGNPRPGLSLEEIEMAVSRFHIVDKLKVPENLKPGKYVLSWRWDCEQARQVFTTCSTINVVSDDAPTAAAAPTSQHQLGGQSSQSGSGSGFDFATLELDEDDLEMVYMLLTYAEEHLGVTEEKIAGMDADAVVQFLMDSVFYDMDATEIQDLLFGIWRGSGFGSGDDFDSEELVAPTAGL